MRIETKEQIRQMALRGLGYARIADIVGLPVNTVKSHLQRHPPWWGPEHCQQCGKYIQQDPHRKEKNSARINAAWPTGTVIRIWSTRRPTTI